MGKHIIIVSICLIGLLNGCTELSQSFRNLGKSNIDMVTDINIKKIDEHLKKLTIRLYEKNPQELGKTPQLGIEHRLTQILEYPTNVAYKEIDYLQSVQAIELGLSGDYKHDRVFALMIGISSMLRFSYNNKREAFMHHSLNPQKIYDSARNLERVILRLRGGNNGSKPLLILGPAHGTDSFEDLVTRIISIQDVMARIIADKNNRIINQVIQGTATVLIPIPI